MFGDLDSLARDLGNPDARVVHAPGPFIGPLINASRRTRRAADGGPFNEFANFQKIQVAFADLRGRSEFIADAAGDEQAAGSDLADPHDTLLWDHN